MCPEAQRKVREPLGFVRGPSFESMAIIFAIDGACIPVSVRRAHLPHALTHMLKHNELRVQRWAFGEAAEKGLQIIPL